MKLDAHLAKIGMSNIEFGRLIEASESTVSRLRNGKQQPSNDLMRRIARHTNNEVMPNDFFADIEMVAPTPEVAA